MRAELLSIEQLKRFAQELARRHTIEFGPGYNRLLPRLDENARVLREAHGVLVAADAAGRRTTPPEEWLLDNFYLIEQHIELARIHLPRRYSRLLPRLTQGPMRGLPRVYGMAFELISHLDGLLDAEAITAYVAAYQTVSPLRLGELWAFPISLRLGLIENLRRVAVNVAERRRQKNDAIAWAERTLATAEREPRQLIHLLAEFADAHPTLSPSFLEEFVDRLQRQGGAVSLILNWIDQSLAEEGTTVAQRLQADAHTQAAEHLSVANSIGSLRFLSAMDWKEFVESQSRVEQILRRDPVGAHPLQDFATRDHYRHVIEDLAFRSGRPEFEVAEMALEMVAAAPPDPDGGNRGRHVGAYLVGAGRQRLRRAVGCPWSLPHFCGNLARRVRLPLYLGAIFTGALAVALLPPWLAGVPPHDWRFVPLVLAALLPASALSLSLINFLVTLHVPPHPLPRLDFRRAIPPSCGTMVVVPTLLPDAATLSSLLSGLEIRYLGNRDPQLRFALLTDFPDAGQETLPGDAELLRRAREGIEHLNARYPREDDGSTFFLFHRPRVWNPHERLWMGYERKRGKLEQFNSFLRGGPREAFSLIVGDLATLPRIRYVITLDADTDLPRGTACRMIGAMAHPLNRPLFDEKRDRVVDGYAILQPRVTVRLTAAGRTLFTRLTCGPTGLDPYSQEVSDVYQDLFGEGSYVGKGIYDVDAFRQALEGRFPENLILSHDLLESAYARSGLLGAVEIYEDTPSSYLGEVCRQHRWMRGDWQIAPWLRARPPCAAGQARRRPVSMLSQWKILDNLRRALFAPVLLALLIIGWAAGPVSARAWTIFALAVAGLTALLRTLTLLMRKPRERNLRLHLRSWSVSMLRHLALPLFNLAVLPFEAVMALDAFRRSALRMLFTRRGLLIWHLDLYRRLQARRTPGAYLAGMWPAPAIALLSAALLAARRPAALPAALPLLVLWLVAPLAAWRISTPRPRKAPLVTEAQVRMLRRLACRTWRFFERFVNAEENWLPPDNYQEIPNPMVASRTSPTNIGFMLLSNLAAWDFGYISTARLAEHTRLTFETLERLERYRGHFYNWYNTRTLEPLPPRYVSSVDSGNLAACLVALRAGLREARERPVLPPQVWRGMRDTLAMLQVEVRAAGGDLPPDFLARLRETDLLLVGPPPDMRAARERLQALSTAAARFREATEGRTTDEVAEWADLFERQCRDHAAAAEMLAAAGAGLETTLAQLARDSGANGENAAEARHQAAGLLRTLETLAERCHELRTAMDFRFLYNAARDLLSIGFDVQNRRLDPSCYDLLASEARIASFLVIAEEQAPPDHWFALGRLLTGQGGSAALLSWSGSMFEYLMPALFMTHHPGTLLAQTCRAVIERQIRYARQRRIPWGISESCYNATDAHHVYQYRAFGVPGLGLKRGLADDLVVAPYATLLALIFAPAEACANLERLIRHEEALGPYGMFEAIDYTPSRVPRGKPRAIVRTYMAHHQGMGLLALAHLLLDAPTMRRFMSDPAVQATEVLLQERVPEVTPAVQPHRREAVSGAARQTADIRATMRVFSDPHVPVPETHLLSNGRYHVMVTNAGGGYSRWQNLALTRWREDTTCDNWGTFLYLRDVETAQTWSAAFHPLRRQSGHYEAIYTQGRAEYRRRDLDMETHTEICVSPEDDVEIRRITLTNFARRERLVELTSYAEVVMAPPAADFAHRVFSNLFVRTEILRSRQAILCTRRKRDEQERDVWMFHLLVVPGRHGDFSFCTDRERFLGRGRTPADPRAMETPAGRTAPLPGGEGAVLDPVVAIRTTVTVADDEPTVAHLVTGAAPSREAALALIDKYRDRHFVDRAFDMSWSHSQIVLRLLNISEAEAQVYGRLAGSVIFANQRNRAAPQVIARNRLGQQGLWRFGISGDLPIVLLRIGDIDRMDLVTDALRAHAYWRLKGLESDLVIINEDFSGYRATLNDRIVAAINACPDAGLLDRPGGIFLRRIENLSEEDQVLFQTAARVILTDTAETLREQVERRYVPRRPAPPLEPTEDPQDMPPPPLPPRKLLHANGLGGFAADGREYVVRLKPGHTTPAPWVNVIAGPSVGTVVSESGGMYTWVDNAHEYRLTTWHNDPVADPTGEAFYLRDERTGRFWSPMPRPAPGRGGYLCRHGFGYTVFEHAEDGLLAETWVYVAVDAPVKFVAVRLRNVSGRGRRLSLTAFHELVLGEWRHTNLMHVHTEHDAQSGMLLARNPFSRVFPERVVFAACSDVEAAVSGNRTEFLGRNGSLEDPDALHRLRLTGRTGAGYDPAAALQTVFDLPAGQEHEVVFTLGAAADVNEARRLRQSHGGVAGARLALETAQRRWERLLGAVRVEGTPELHPFAPLANGWLAYQAISSRIWGRSGYYQSGGAYGFRDQLQDAMAMLHADPLFLRTQILLCASRQFPEGDVQHWWHPPSGAGVRTRFSDDMLWLPQAVARYVLATGDTAVLRENIPFLEGRQLAPGEESQYDHHVHGSQSASLYEHCLRAIRRSLRFGPRGLPLIGCGDWNDGLNRVGKEDRGESVWLGWFICDTLRRFSEIARLHDDPETVRFCRREEETLRHRLEETAWDGAWYRRAYFDDGTPLGAAANDECRIDAISQSWAVISGAARPERARQAMRSVREHLVREKDRLVLLFTPPFDQSALDPGYIKGYPPGVRENGGQYTHAAIWTVMAFALLGEHEEAWRLCEMLNPVTHGDSPVAITRYRVEPYVMAADVYSVPPHVGRGGWTWYTGAAGWMYRLLLETFLGLERRPGHLRFNPRLPAATGGEIVLRYRFGETGYRIALRQARPDEPPRVTLDGVAQDDGLVPLYDDRRDHKAEVVWRATPSAAEAAKEQREG